MIEPNEIKLYEDLGEIKTSLRHIESKVNIVTSETDNNNLRIADLELKRTLDKSIAENSERKMKKIMATFGIIVTSISSISAVLYRHALNTPTVSQNHVIHKLQDRLNSLENKHK